jgi:hypothetical protein
MPSRNPIPTHRGSDKMPDLPLNYRAKIFVTAMSPVVEVSWRGDFFHLDNASDIVSSSTAPARAELLFDG